MYLKQLHLENFRNFEFLDIEFNDHLTVIVGNNGAGKTTILEAAAISIGTFFGGINDIPTTGIRKSDARIKTYALGSTEDVQYQYPVVIKSEGAIDGIPRTWERSLQGEGGRTYIKDAKELTSVAAAYQARIRMGDTKLTLPLLAYYGTGRLWDYHKEKIMDVFKNSSRINGYVDCLGGTPNLKLMLNWFKKKTIQKYQRQEENMRAFSELDIVYGAMAKCFQAITGYTDVKLQYNLDTNEIDVYYSDCSNRRMRIPLNSLSDGYKCTISLIADIAYRMAILNPNLQGDALNETEGIVLIDEVDLHLHPRWQQRILSDLRTIFPKVQFIVSTHAPAIINSVRNENLAILEEGEIIQPVSQTYGRDANAVLQGIMKTVERPQEIKDLFTAFYQAIDNNELSDAHKIIEEIESKIGTEDSELTACRVKLKLAQFKGGF